MFKQISLLVCIILFSFSNALANEQAFCDTPPTEVKEHIASRWADWSIEDYALIEDTPDGDYSFALLNRGSARMLIGYRERDGHMAYWLKSEPVAPQGKGHGWLLHPKKGEEVMNNITDMLEVSDGLSFTIRYLVPNSENSYRSVSFHWENNGFKLHSFYDYDQYYGTAYVKDGYLDYWNWGVWEHDTNVYGVLQTELRYVDFASLPKSPEQARESLSTPPVIPAGTLNAQEMNFVGGQKYDVYLGPGKSYARSGNGKGSVSTNDWIQVFGEYDGYIMIQYDLSSDRYRIGWIDATSLPKGKTVDLLVFDEYEMTLSQACVLTDDPLRSQSEVVYLPEGTPVTRLATLGDWLYVRVQTSQGLLCGFVSSDCVLTNEQ